MVSSIGSLWLLCAMEIDGFFFYVLSRAGIYKQKRWELTWTLFVQLASNESFLTIVGWLQPH